MSGKTFGEKVKDQRKEQALLSPTALWRPGAAAVCLAWRTVSRDSIKSSDFNDGHPEYNWTIYRKPAEYTDVFALDEAGNPLENTSFRHWKVVPDSVWQARVLSAIYESFEHVISYSNAFHVPFDVSQTYDGSHRPPYDGR